MALILFLIVLSLVIVVFIVIWRELRRSLWLLTSSSGRTGNSPFRKAFPPSPPAEVVTSQRERDRVLKQSFSVDKIPSSLDAIVIGKH